VHLADFVTVALLIALETFLSADNALVMAVMALGLPERQRRQALSYGLVGAFAFRSVATLLAFALIRVDWVKLVGGLYLAYLSYAHFSQRGDAGARQTPRHAQPRFGLSAFWATVVQLEVINIAFSIDSILVAVAMSPKLWVVLTGSILGLVALRAVAVQMLVGIQRYPALIDAAFIIIGWVAVTLVIEYAHAADLIGWSVPSGLSLGVIVAILAVAFLYARARGPRPIR
jgi:YkoY family integral membrane protein